MERSDRNNPTSAVLTDVPFDDLRGLAIAKKDRLLPKRCDKLKFRFNKPNLNMVPGRGQKRRGLEEAAATLVLLS